MKGISTLLLVLFLFSARGYSQQRTTYTIQGTTKSPDTGRMILMNVNTEDYYPFHGTLEATVINGRFSFTDSMFYPVAYRMGLKQGSLWKFVSEPFFIDSGVQTLFYNSDSSWQVPVIKNRSMFEWQNDFNTHFASYNSEYDQFYHVIRDSLYRVYKGKFPDSLRSFMSSREKELGRTYRSTLLSYVKEKPGSYVALWKVVSQLSAGYEPSSDTLYNALSDVLRETYTGKVLKHKLDVGRLSCIGCRFPDLKFAPVHDLSRKVSLSQQFSKYTLIDIWFSHCGACIDQFPKFKELYARFRDSGFQLISVSTDTKSQIQNWKKEIKRNALPWPQYLDETETVTKKLSIIGWPSNFLIDEKGIIIQKNISPEELEHFLSANFRSKLIVN